MSAKDDRELIFKRVQDAVGPLKERAAYPEWDDEMAVCRAHPDFEADWDLFAYRFSGVNGTPMISETELSERLMEEGVRVAYVDPALAERFGELFEDRIQIETVFDATDPDRYDCGITRAAAVIAESGTVMLTEGMTSSRLGTLAPWIHVAVVAPDAVLGTIPEAIRLFGDDPNIVWATGPSKTADVEGILIEGVHGPGIQICLLDGAAVG